MSEKKSLVAKFAERYELEPENLLKTLKATAFKQRGNTQITNEQMAALLVVADQYELNPFTKEIYAFPDKNGGIVPVVGVDGWARIINSHPNFDGMEFAYSSSIVKHKDEEHKPCPSFIECIIHRKDREHTTPIREYFDEVYREPFRKDGYVKTGPWQTHTKRMLRHKALIQAARFAFSFAGIYDEDEANRIIEGESYQVDSKADDLNQQLIPKKEATELEESLNETVIAEPEGVENGDAQESE